MIKVTELMINDWVSINDSNYLVKDIKKKGIIKLWKKVKGFKNANEAKILNYFMIAELYNKGLYYCGVGSSWGSPCDKETCEQYLSDFEVIRKAYRDWCISQR